MLHIYCGDGKGKTTAAAGLCLRMAGRGKRAVFAQFLKSADSGERAALSLLPGVVLTPVPEEVKFVFAMSEDERAEASVWQRDILCRAFDLAGGADLLVLDELSGALSTGMIPQEEVLGRLDALPEATEVVITGRNPPQALLDRADYITEMRKIRHPYDAGAGAREGIEY